MHFLTLHTSSHKPINHWVAESYLFHPCSYFCCNCSKKSEHRLHVNIQSILLIIWVWEWYWLTSINNQTKWVFDGFIDRKKNIHNTWNTWNLCHVINKPHTHIWVESSLFNSRPIKAIVFQHSFFFFCFTGSTKCLTNLLWLVVYLQQWKFQILFFFFFFTSPNAKTEFHSWELCLAWSCVWGCFRQSVGHHFITLLCV